jgi:hypothetical protein
MNQEARSPIDINFLSPYSLKPRYERLARKCKQTS